MKGLFLVLLLIGHRNFVQSMNFNTEAHTYVYTKLKLLSLQNYTINSLKLLIPYKAKLFATVRNFQQHTAE